MIEVIPAIDLKDGRCVRLKQGAFAEQTVYSEHPLEVARQFDQAGAQRLHLVDLDGAETGTSHNAVVVEEILSACHLPVQLGGGIRTLADIERWLNLGISAVIVGTLAMRDPERMHVALQRWPAQLILAVDARDGKVVVSGWQEKSSLSAAELALQFKPSGLQRVLYTDVERDGMLSGPNVSDTRELAVRTGLAVTASGGVSSLEDLHQLTTLTAVGVDSVVVGKAFYEGRIQPSEVFDAR